MPRKGNVAVAKTAAQIALELRQKAALLKAELDRLLEAADALDKPSRTTAGGTRKSR